MSVSLIVTKSHDRDFEETGERIPRDEWIEYVEAAPDLRFCTRVFAATNPATGQKVAVRPGDAQAELLGTGEPLPFLRYRSGSLVMRLGFDPDDAQHPIRRRVAEVARHFEALITHDAGDEILDW